MFARRRIAIATTVLLALVLSSSAAFAWKGWVQNDSLFVCVANANGAIRAVSSSDLCKSQEEPVTLAVGVGGIGATGATGPQGDTGAAGPAGPAGDPGAVGPAGPAGATGVAGPVGATGANGANGAPGATGATGPAGPAGPAGPTGDTGVAGVAGPAGPVGATGAGAPGPAGATGAQGVAGTTGQNALTVPSTASLTLSSGSRGPLAVPGLSATVDTLANSVLYLETEGVIVNNGLAAGNYVQVSVRILVDGAVAAERVYDVEMGQNAFTGHWNVATTVAPAAGTHTVLVDATLKSSVPTTVSATLAGMPTSVTKGTLNVLVLNK